MPASVGSAPCSCCGQNGPGLARRHLYHADQTCQAAHRMHEVGNPASSRTCRPAASRRPGRCDVLPVPLTDTSREVPACRTPSIQRFRQAGPVAWNVSRPGVGGCTCDGVRSAATSDVATTRSASTRPRTRTRRVILSSAASSLARIGFGTTGRTDIWKGPASNPQSIIPWTNRCRDQPEGSLPTGKIFLAES